jgi:hypothetical protein
MKIEIDTSKPDELRKIKRELEALLSSIDAALLSINRNGEVPAQQPALPAPVGQTSQPMVETPTAAEPPRRTRAPRRTAVYAISTLGPEFSTTEARLAADNIGVSDAQVRRELRRQIARGELTPLEPGRGRAPATYRKVQA